MQNVIDEKSYGLFTRTVPVSVPVTISLKVYHCANGNVLPDWQNWFGTDSDCQTLNFELDSEEATHCDHCHLIKGYVKMVDTKDQSNAIVYCLLTLSIWRSKYRMHWMLCLSRLVILVFVALTQHCIQSTMRCENSTLHKVASCPSKGGRLLYCAFCLVGVAVHQSQEAAFLTSWTCQLQGWLQARCMANP